jgi:hypothetical protein
MPKAFHKTLLGCNLNEGVLNVFEDNGREVLDVAKTSCSSFDGFIILFFSPRKIMIDCKIM